MLRIAALLLALVCNGSAQDAPDTASEELIPPVLDHAADDEPPGHDLDDIKGGEFINAVFFFLDEDDNEELSEKELTKFEFLCDKANFADGKKFHKEEAMKKGEEMMGERDADGDGVVSLTEFLEEDNKGTFQMIISVEGAWEKELTARKAVFEFADADKSGKCSSKRN
jgi:hypothetical protein